MEHKRFSVTAIVLATILMAGCNTERDWKQARDTNTTAAYSHFLAIHSWGAHVEEAKADIEDLDFYKATSIDKPSAFRAFYRAHPHSGRIDIRQGTIAIENVYVEESTGLHGGTMSSKPEATIDGSKVDINIDGLCRLGIVECQADIYGSPDYKGKAKRTGMIYRGAGRRILAIDFADKGTSKQSDAIRDASVTDDLEGVETLLNADPNLALSKDVLGDTPLLEAAAWGNRDVAELLLANHADVNAKKFDGVTPLHWAVKQGNRELVELLLANHADVNAKDFLGVTPLHWAVQRGNKELEELLREHGGHE